jgi:hypothetical protein
VPDKTNPNETSTDHTSRIARDLRAYADAGMEPVFANKLLAIAAELEALAGAREIKAA